jgi:cytochrome b6
VLPGITTLLLFVHWAAADGMSSPPWIRNHKAALPNFFLRELMAWYAALGVLGCLAALFPWELGQKADPFAPAPAGIRPEWYFLAPFYTLKLLPAFVWKIEGELLGLIGFSLLAAWWVALPFWATDRAACCAQMGNRSRCAALSYLAAFSALGYWK